MSTPLHALTGTQVAKLLKSNIITVEQYAAALWDRIQERDSTVKAWAYLDPEFVFRQARALDQTPQERRQPLHGVAIGIKDVINTQDMPTQFGSPIYQGHQSGFDSSAVGILRAAGALIFGKTTTTEFTVANSGPGTTNPHDPNRTPGGSSCGSAAAVADFQVPLSLGAQTAGSVIRPASFTGIFAMKPTHNLISTEGSKSFSPMFDTLGFFARSLEDLQLVADVFALEDDEPPTSVLLRATSVALVKTPMWSWAGPGTVAAMEKAARILRDSGVDVHEVSLPQELGDLQTLKRMQKVIMSGEARAAFLREYMVDNAQLGPEIAALVENSAKYSRKQMAESLDRYAAIRPIADKFVGGYAAIITPSAVDEAPLGLDNMGSAAFNTLWTGLHMPVINIPAFVGQHGMPVGISLVAGRYQDRQLLRVATVLSKPLMVQGAWNFGEALAQHEAPRPEAPCAREGSEPVCRLLRSSVAHPPAHNDLAPRS
ncbi:amidase signature domain-containing protein [Staphylotrichum tortipilum]|uniref:Amidase signature domain-containing protein n=1 Tax=Staphylotrichum tortipilum TaxID=2831512 RepID=A0AAN6RQ42_9PEZI|nr:amidase signature domain-containing protein [Staphylotrichum longicolle]